MAPSTMITPASLVLTWLILSPFQDDQLSVQEIMQEFDFFMDSELTEFGGHTVHDEL